MKIIIKFVLILFVITACSLDTQTGIWNDKVNELQLSNINVDDLNYDLPFDEYKKIIITYGKHSKFPDINN